MDFRNKGLVRKGDIGMEGKKNDNSTHQLLKGIMEKKKKEEDASTPKGDNSWGVNLVQGVPGMDVYNPFRIAIHKSLNRIYLYMYSEKDYDGKKPSGLQLDFFRKYPNGTFP